MIPKSSHHHRIRPPQVVLRPVQLAAAGSVVPVVMGRVEQAGREPHAGFQRRTRRRRPMS